jgi:hypothetical protein
MRSLKSPEAVAAYINLLAAIVTLIAACASQHDEPAGKTQQIVVNTNTTNVTNEPALCLQQYPHPHQNQNHISSQTHRPLPCTWGGSSKQLAGIG